LPGVTADGRARLPFRCAGDRLLRSVTTGALWCHRAASQAAYRDAERATASTGDPEIAARTNAEPDDV